MSKPDYDTTLARVAGNIAAGIAPQFNMYDEESVAKIAAFSVEAARAIVAEVKRTEIADTPNP